MSIVFRARPVPRDEKQMLIALNVSNPRRVGYLLYHIERKPKRSTESFFDGEKIIMPFRLVSNGLFLETPQYYESFLDVNPYADKSPDFVYQWVKFRGEIYEQMNVIVEMPSGEHIKTSLVICIYKGIIQRSFEKS